MMLDPMEQLWDGLLSRQPEQIRSAYAGLDAAGKQAILTHLKKMTTEDGWLDVQRESAQAALDALKAKTNPRHRKPRTK